MTVFGNVADAHGPIVGPTTKVYAPPPVGGPPAAPTFTGGAVAPVASLVASVPVLRLLVGEIYLPDGQPAISRPNSIDGAGRALVRARTLRWRPALQFISLALSPLAT